MAKRKMPVVDKGKRFIAEFYFNCSTHGFEAFARRKYWLLLWAMCCASFGIWEFHKTLKSFLSYDVETTVKSQEIGRDGMQFPAVTFCSNSGYSRRALEGFQLLITSAYAVAGMSIDEATKWSASCHGSSSIAPAGDKMINIPLNGFTATMKSCQVDSFKAVTDCYFNRKSFNCSRQFLNKLGDLGFCFTMNSSPNVIDAYALDSREIGAYGTSGKEKLNFVSHLSGPKSGLHLDMISNESDYCAMVFGAQTGFMAVVHDPDSEPLLSMKAMIMLSPGFHHNVAMRVRKTERNTEELGFCTSKLFLFTFNTTVSYTSRDKYLIDCVTLEMIKECKCYPFYASPITPQIFPAKFQVCQNELTICQQKLEKKQFSAESKCYKSIPVPCSESKVSAQLTSIVYPAANQLSALKQKYIYAQNMTLKQFRRNYLSVNFYLASTNFVLATENLAMTWVDLMNCLGGAAGMCLGMSILSVVELLAFFIIKPISAFLHYGHQIGKERAVGRGFRHRYVSDNLM